MPSSIKDPALYEELRKEGASKRKAARAANAGGHKSGRYDDWTVYELKMRVKELGMQGYADKSRAELIAMLQHH